MVAALVRLRLLVLRNSLKRSVGQLVAVIIGALYGLFVLGLIVVGLFALNLAPVDLDGAGGGVVKAHDALDERRLAGPVLAEQGVEGARRHLD